MRWKVGLGVLGLGAGLLLAPSTVAAAGDPPPSVKAPLSAKAYAGLACDPFDRTLRKTALANGVGPEARVAAACWALEWRARSKVTSPRVIVHASPGFPQRLTKRLRAGTVAGHRLFGRFADVQRYEVLASVDPAYSCRTGKQEYDPRNIAYPHGPRDWSQAWNSGCPGTDYGPGGWTSSILGEGGRDYFAWTLIKPEQREMLSNSVVLGPTWFMGAVSHEFVHSIQMQRSRESTNGQESMGRWYGEGQAQYLGNTAAGWTIGPADIRSAQLRQLREVMRQEKVRTIKLESMERDWQTDLVHPAGYFAYEWLVAHYGIEATFTWWNEWNRDCERPGSSVCWREKAPELFGMSAADLLRELNAYVNAQVAR